MIILALCLIPSSEIQKFDILEISYLDLLGHLIMFFIFSAFLMTDLRKYYARHDKSQLLIIALSVNLLLGVSTEILQYVLDFLNRTANVYDLLFDCLGAALGLISVKFIRRKSDPGS
jgi:glycopeptide antibiotics resistance protein